MSRDELEKKVQQLEERCRLLQEQLSAEKEKNHRLMKRIELHKVLSRP